MKNRTWPASKRISIWFPWNMNIWYEWNQYPKKISSFMKPYVPLLLLLCSKNEEPIKVKPWLWEIFQKTFLVFVSVEKESRKQIHMMLQKSTRQETCEMKLNNRNYKKKYSGWFSVVLRDRKDDFVCVESLDEAKNEKKKKSYRFKSSTMNIFGGFLLSVSR